MRPLLILVVAATCAFARPLYNGGTPLTPDPELLPKPMQERYPPQTLRNDVGDYVMNPFLQPSYSNVITLKEVSAQINQYDWITKELDRLALMEAVEDEILEAYEPTKQRDEVDSIYDPFVKIIVDEGGTYIQRVPIYDDSEEEPEFKVNDRLYFGYSPLDKEFYDPALEKQGITTTKGPGVLPQDKSAETVTRNEEIHEPRQIRQNPNLSKTKTLVAEDLDKLRSGIAGKDYRMPVSLLPINMRWLKMSHSDDDYDDYNNKSTHENESNNHSNDLVKGNPSEPYVRPIDTFYSVVIIAAVGSALTAALAGVAVGWYTLSKKAKAAADVDYPAYGVTGPSTDSSGDRKLAHSAHMYHYQHQKQQILAMEKDDLVRKGSVSDPESEEENEEGDYTVYECPGFATTGVMEVKNPMFDDSTPTPDKAEPKPQPKK